MFKYDDIYAEVAKEYGVSPKYIRQIYMSFWRFIRMKMVSTPIPKGLSREEFDNLRTAISVIRLGKFGVSWDRYSNIDFIKDLIKKYKIKYHNKKQERLKQNDSGKESEADV